MDAVIIVVVFECGQFLAQVTAIPEKNSVQILPANGADEPLDKRMRDEHLRHGADGLDFQNAQIGFPTLKAEPGIMVQTETDGKALTGNGLIEHATKCDAIDGVLLHSKANDSPC